MSPLSLLDLSPIVQGSDAAQAFRNTRDLARNAERLGYNRFWLAEHHNMRGIASAATSVLIGHVADATTTIRVGSGGIMLPNHAPLAIAEQFGTLATLYPDRIDLGVGRAPGSDQATARALRRTLNGDVDRFPQDVVELIGFFEPLQEGQIVQAVPGGGLKVPVWILGSSLFGASLAAHLGLPFAFASHFAPAQLSEAVAIYRDRFQPSRFLDKPYLMLGLGVLAAPSDEEATHLFTSQQQAFLNLRTGRAGPLPPPVDDMDQRFAAAGMSGGMEALSAAVVGSPQTVQAGLAAFVAKHAPDEVIITSQVFDYPARLRSFELAMAAWKGLDA